MSSIIGGLFRLVGTLVKYGFYTIVVSGSVVCIFCYLTKPENKTLKITGVGVVDSAIKGITQIEIKDWVILKTASNNKDGVLYIGALNTWFPMK
jgi:hypothetical protein